MGRRSSPVEDIMEITARLPWWAGLLLALISYLLLHQFAVSDTAPISMEPGKLNIAPTLLKTFARIGQYILPIIFMVGALGSFIKRKKQDRLYTKASTNTPLLEINKMSWHDFEQLTAAAFRKRGYLVQDTNDGPDGGIDLVLKKDGENYLVQCKHWRANKVGVAIVRELLGVMASRGVAGGFVVTAGEYTKEAKSFAEGRNIELIEGTTLDRWMRQSTDRKTIKDELAIDDVAVPHCPKCNEKMVKRVAKKGATAGKAFWGCSSYPKCRGTISIG